MAASVDEHELAHRAYDLAMGVREAFGQQLLPSPAAVAEAQMSALPNSFASQLIAQGYPIQALPPWNPAPPQPVQQLDPLELAIRDVNESIYTVIRLAEERA